MILISRSSKGQQDAITVVHFFGRGIFRPLFLLNGTKKSDVISGMIIWIGIALYRKAITRDFQHAVLQIRFLF
ncbi:MAG TPA: hypothetical protein EYO58_11850 [Flavobacteriales bacterium]|nr:hypothetical protein [Flavobacteriales bacterium]